MTAPVAVRMAAVIAVPMLLQGVTACALRPHAPVEPAPGVAAVRYQPYGAGYRGTTFTWVEQRFDDRATEIRFGLRYFLHAAVTGTQSPLEVEFVIDSIGLGGRPTAGISQAHVDSARGATYHATLSTAGRLSGFSGGEGAGSVATELTDRVLQQFFPLLPDEGVRPGARWADTVDSRMSINGIEHEVLLASSHEALQWTSHAGRRALHILSTSSYTFSGSGTQAGHTFTIEGRGRRHAHKYIGDDGRYLGLVSADTSEGEARVLDLDIVIPIRQTRVDSLSLEN